MVTTKAKLRRVISSIVAARQAKQTERQRQARIRDIRGELELKEITQKVTVKAGKPDISKLTSGERARIRQLTGVEAEEAFSVETKPLIEK